MKNDRELQIDVLDELRWEPGVKATDIGATVKDGVVTLGVRWIATLKSGPPRGR